MRGSAALASRVLVTLRFVLLIASGVLVLQGTALAWKPITHVYLAEQARLDAVEDGRVTIWATDFESGQLRRDAAGQPIRIGEYDVDPTVLTALRTCAAQYRAGTLGPDAYPDIMTGQQIIHPAGRNTPGEPVDMDLNPGGPGPDPWLQYLWSRAFQGRNPDGSQPDGADVTPQTQAFVLGYLSHAAGDMYGHTFMNHFTGGPFHFMPRPENAVKHVVLEGYVCKRTPPLPSYDASIAGVEGFITRNMVQATPGSYLEARLLRGDNTRFSLPFIFSRLRAQLQREIDDYYRQKADYQARVDARLAAAAACRPTDFSCSRVALTAEAGAIKTQQTAFMVRYGPWVTYQEHWRDDIDAGLAAFPELSHQLAIALMFNPAGTTDVARAQALVHEYEVRHLISMAGAPDFVGSSIEAIDRVMDALGIPAVKQAIAEMKANLLDYLVKQATGLSVDDWKGYASDPERWFDPVLGSPAFNTEGSGTLVSLQDFNQRQLRITDTGSRNMDEKFDLASFPPAYNTTTMIKLLLMSPAGLRQLMSDLGAPGASPAGPNAMLGFIETLDGSNQWKANASKMVVASDDRAYRKIFMRQAAFGERDEPGGTPAPEPPAPTNLALGKPARQSSTAYGEVGTAAAAVDGNTDGAWNDRSVTHTDMENGWWEVDLGSVCEIRSVRVWNRTDCCRERLRDFRILVSESPITGSDAPVIGGGPQSFGDEDSREFRAEPALRGRWVRIVMDRADYLSLAEVQVFGTAGGPGSCPDGFRDGGNGLCAKPAPAPRRIYAAGELERCERENPQGCEVVGLTVAARCPPGTQLNAMMCAAACPPGYVDMGLFCRKP